MPMVDIFRQCPGAEPGLGYYVTEFEPDFEAGWFGTADKAEYYWEDRRTRYGWQSRNCGADEGCFWTDWYPNIEEC